MVAYYFEHIVGKTFTIARMLKYYIHELGVRDFVIAAPSSFDLVQTVIKGNSGILRSYHDDDPERPNYSPHFNTLTYPCGAVGRLVSSESPERSRGASTELLIADELGSFSGDALDFFEQLEYSLRNGISQAIIATTPRKTPLMLELVKRAKDPNGNVRVITGSTLENDQLSEQMRTKALSTMHTKRGLAEVQGKMILVNDLALWSEELLDKCRTQLVGEYSPANWVRACIGVDPAGESTAKSSDKTGIVAAILTNTNKVVVIKDRTDRMSGQEAVKRIYTLYRWIEELCPVKIRVEKNSVGAYFKSMIHREHPFLAIEEFASTNKKYARAQALAHLYETGIVFHDSDAELLDLETEMTSWEGTGKSPDHIDGTSFAVEGLTGTKNFVARKKFIL